MPEERKLVTVLFADVTGSTALGEDLDPEDVRALMGRYYDHARLVVRGHGGTPEKFIGDAIMAIFGLPYAHGDDAERAVAAALALQKAVENDSVLQEMTLRIGINTGEVVATSDPSSGDFLVTGDAVNVAARLQQCANPGEILTSERTHAASEAAFVFGEGREVAVKGKREPLRVFPAVGVRPIRQVERPPLVGRKRELAQLSLLQSWALEEHRPQLVSIVAPAGIGKTRLLEEFLARIDPDEGWRRATGRCLPYGQALTYWPLRGLLEGLVGEIERDRVIDAFAQGGHSPEDATRLADLVLAPLGIETEGLTERESIFNAWRLLIDTLAKEAPRIVVFEDLHWASDSLLDLVEHVMHPRTQAPLLIIAISRPELLDRRPTWGGGGRQSFTSLVLEPLNEAQTAELVEHLGGMLPATLLQQIVERSGGNPFFATELVRGLAERGIGGKAQDPDVVPDTVHAAVLARLDALWPVERAVAQAASVAGRSFRPATLAAVLDNLGLGEIDAAIEGLVARDLAMPSEGDAYTFRHVLIRDVAYGTLSRAERIRMHAAVAAWLEGYAADRLDEFVELVAYHYREAVVLSRRSSVPLPLPFDVQRAVALLTRAGQLAHLSGAIAEARNHFQDAIDFSPDEEQAALYELLGDCLPYGDAARGAYQAALDHWSHFGGQDPLFGARLLRKLLVLCTGYAPSLTERPSEEEVAWVRTEAMRLAEAAGDEDELWRVRVADVYWRLTWRSDVDPEEAHQTMETTWAAASYFEARQGWDSFSRALDAYMGQAQAIGAHDRAIEAAQRRLKAPELTWVERSDAIGNLASAHLAAGNYDRCVTIAQEALVDQRPGEPAAFLFYAVALASFALSDTGRWSELDALLETAEAAWEEVKQDPPPYALMPYTSALDVAMAREDRVGADAAAAVLERLPADQFGSVRMWAAACRDDDPSKLDLAVLRTSPYTYRHYDLALWFLNERGIRAEPWLLDTAWAQQRQRKYDNLLRSLQIAQALADQDTVRLREAIDDAEQHGLIPHAARMRIILAQMTGDSAPLDQARPVLERLEDRQFLRRLEEVAATVK